MYTLLILFFISLLGIIFMIGRKLVLLKKGKISIGEQIPLIIIPLEKVKSFTLRSIRRYGHATIVISLTLYIRGANLLKNKYRELKVKIQERNKLTQANGDKKEISKFLKIIGEYKKKIRDIKHRITKEENL